ncbi:LysR substrate-binding domain-containing protein [uncultured Jannaschia sp.]|uniref:LysR substrate-binding domain-containing protein n=1 Tax=uncultured Jannaschia sp. TaxID=293347 RepID=UPI00261D3AE4|nr:LysR substrate-binding domain-containing protein [uncultured Jannaschia sp.]
MPSHALRLPSLNALRAFEAAARHGGFVDAAEELHVTRGAVSRHVKGLEADLGVALFVRQAQGVRLTATGARLLPVLTEAFGRVGRELDRIRAEAQDLRILCPPATSVRWLIPRLDAFRRIHPDLCVRLTTGFHRPDGFDGAEYDVAFSVESWLARSDSIVSQTLFPVRLTPACAPQLLARTGPLGIPADLARYEILHETPQRHDWTAWAQSFDPEGALDLRGGLDFPNLDTAMRAAVAGAGVVMADLVLCREELASGALVTPFPQMVCAGPFGGVSLLAARDAWHDPKVARFRGWAVAAAEDEAPFQPQSPGG